jgi:hypothetical protein
VAVAAVAVAVAAVAVAVSRQQQQLPFQPPYPLLIPLEVKDRIPA